MTGLTGNLKMLVCIPDEIKDSFWEQFLDNNWRLLSVTSLLAVLVQAVNIFHVLAVSESGLKSINNRIYFTFYCVFFLANLLFGLFHKRFQLKHCQREQRILQGSFCAFWIIWSSLINYYDILKAEEAGNISVIVTSVMGAAIIIQNIPLYSLCVYGGTCLLFSLAAYPYIEFGGLINVMIAGGMAVIVSAARYWYKIKELLQQREIQTMNERLMAEQEELNLSLEKFQLLMDKIDHIIYEWDMESGKVSFSAKWVENFGESSQITNAAKWFQNTECMDPEGKRKFLKGMKKALEDHRTYEEEIQLTDIRKEVQWYLLRLYFQYGKDGVPKSGVGFLINIQRQMDELEFLESEVSRDYLTGVMNRKGIQEYGEKLLNQKQPGQIIAMILIDLDGFKKINDNYGHPFGDQILVKTGEILLRIFGTQGLAGRIGGDEFMVILSVSDLEELNRKVKELKKNPVVLECRGEKVTAEFCTGMAAAGEGEDYQSLYQRADQALYMAKEAGRGKVYLTR